MKTTMSTSARLRVALAEKGIRSGRELADYLGSEAEIFFVRGGDDWEGAHAVLKFEKDGRKERRKFFPTSHEYHREECLSQAKADAARELGIQEWSRAPFSNCWLPSEDVARVHEEFDS